MIDTYHFGLIVINKIPYKNDVIVFRNRVESDWWRQEGHNLQLADIQKSLDEYQPRTLVVGTGRFGIMKISEEIHQYAEERGIKLHAEPTEKAVKMYNRLILTDDHVMGAFHLTC